MHQTSQILLHNAEVRKLISSVYSIITMTISNEEHYDCN